MKTGGKCYLLIGILFATSATLTAQTIISVNPNTAQLGQSIVVAIDGQNTHFEQGSDTVIWLSQGSQDIYAYGYYPYDDTLLIAGFDIPVDAEIGLYDLNVYNNIDGTVTLYNGFTITPGNIISAYPNSAQQGRALSVAITGQNTHFEQGTDFQQGSPTTVWLSQGSETVYAKSSWGVNDTLLIANFDIPCDAATGLQDVSIYNDIDGTLTLYDEFTITSHNPELTSITPRGAYQGQSLSVTITGQNTRFQQGTPFAQGSGTTCWFSQGSPTTYFEQGSPTTCIVWFSQGSSTIFSSDCGTPGGSLLIANFDIPVNANAGLWDVHVPTMADGPLTLQDGFMVIQPGDWTGDGMVNFYDFGVLADNWLEGTDE